MAHSLCGQITATPIDPRSQEGVYRTLCLPVAETTRCDFTLWTKTQRDEKRAFTIKQFAKLLGGPLTSPRTRGPQRAHFALASPRPRLELMPVLLGRDFVQAA
jgi:hypothetical protein